MSFNCDCNYDQLYRYLSKVETLVLNSNNNYKKEGSMTTHW